MVSTDEHAGTATRRMFFALWPSDALRREIKGNLFKWGRFNGRPVAPDNYHITLLFLGNVTEQQCQAMIDWAGTIQEPSFELSLDQLGYWHKPRVVWLGASRVPKSLQQLVMTLRQGAKECGLQADQRDYVAHLTLLRKVSRGPLQRQVRPLSWRVMDFVLVESFTLKEGVQYCPVACWRLSAKK